MTIDKRNGDVAFNSESHAYWNVKDNGRYVSVTTLIGRYASDFDSQFWSAYKALERLLPADSWQIERKSLLSSKRIGDELLETHGISRDELNHVQQEILDRWAEENRKSCERGTRIHEEIENSFYDHPRDITLDKFGIGGKFECKRDYADLDLEYGVYPEYLIHRESDDGVLRIAGQVDLIVKRGNDITIIDHKGLPLDTPILTDKGFVTMGALKVGDKVYDKEGRLCDVTVKSGVHHNPCYEICFEDSESVVADVEHRWLVTYREGSGQYVDAVMTTAEVKENLGKELFIRNPEPLEGDGLELPVDPYVLGAWLAKGKLARGRIALGWDSPVWDEIKKRGCVVGGDERTYHGGDVPERKVGRTVYGLRKALEELGMLHGREIPDRFLTMSSAQRLCLLGGIMDSVGSRDGKWLRARLPADFNLSGFTKLLSTFGVKPRVKAILSGDGFDGWDVSFVMSGFSAASGAIPPEVGESWRRITDVRETETVPTQCIAVDSPSHTYLFGESLIVTHNTNKRIDMKSGFDAATKSNVKMKYPLNNLMDSNYWHYALQLSTYAWMLQKINPGFVIRDLILNHYDHQGKNTLYHCDYLKREVEKMLYHYKKGLLLQERRDKRKGIEY